MQRDCVTPPRYAESVGSVTSRRLYVTWRHPAGSILPVGLLTQRADSDNLIYEFAYLKLAEQQVAFEPLPGLPDLHRRYESPRLFPVFANRQVPRERPDYDAFVQQLDLDAEADPFEVLARSEGRRATDRIEVFAAPTRTDDRLVSLFFARGVRHLDGAGQAIDALHEGDELTLVDDPDNEFNPRALLLNTRTGQAVGFAPDYLATPSTCCVSTTTNPFTSRSSTSTGRRRHRTCAYSAASRRPGPKASSLCRGWSSNRSSDAAGVTAGMLSTGNSFGASSGGCRSCCWWTGHAAAGVPPAGAGHAPSPPVLRRPRCRRGVHDLADPSQRSDHPVESGA